MRSDGTAARCEDLVKTYRTPTSEVRALKGITFGFPRSALTAVVGPSGSGKSSLLRALAGIDRATSGEVIVDQTPVHSASSRRLRRLRRDTVGYVFQRPSDNFLPHLTVGEHLRLAARGPARAGIEATELLETLGIAHRIPHLPSELSGGEQQRAAIAQALVAGAKVVVADEPTAELDSASARGVIDAILDLASAGVSFIVATHDPAVMRRAGAVLELDHGLQRERRRADGSSTPVDRAPVARSLDGPSVLDVDGVSKTYRRGEEAVHALREVRLELAVGSLAGIVGRSGSGKTTLLNVIAGWERPDVGRVRVVDGKEAPAASWSEVAVVPQKLGLLNEFTIRENVEHPARLSGVLDRFTEEVDVLLEELGLETLQDRYPKETSLGEQQRTAIARAVLLGPSLLLADEPTAHQDRGFTTRVFRVLERIAARGSTCLIATHNDEVVPYLDRVFHMEDGRLSEARD